MSVIPEGFSLISDENLAIIEQIIAKHYGMHKQDGLYVEDMSLEDQILYIKSNKLI